MLMMGKLYIFFSVGVSWRLLLCQRNRQVDKASEGWGEGGDMQVEWER